MPKDGPSANDPANRRFIIEDVGQLPRDQWCLLNLGGPDRFWRNRVLEAGLGKDEASQQGRFVWLHPQVCQGCGRVKYQPKLSSSGLFLPYHGCLAGLILLIATSLGIGIWTRSILKIVATFLVGFYLIVVFDYLMTAWQLRPFAKRAQALEYTKGCSHCGQQHFQPVHKTGPVPCPKCGQKTLEFYLSSIS